MDGGEQLGRCLSLLDSGATEEGEGGGGGEGGEGGGEEEEEEEKYLPWQPAWRRQYSFSSLFSIQEGMVCNQ